MKTEPLTIRIDKKLKAEAKKAAREDARSLTSLIVKLLTDYLKEKSVWWPVLFCSQRGGGLWLDQRIGPSDGDSVALRSGATQMWYVAEWRMAMSSGWTRRQWITLILTIIILLLLMMVAIHELELVSRGWSEHGYGLPKVMVKRALIEAYESVGLRVSPSWQPDSARGENRPSVEPPDWVDLHLYRIMVQMNYGMKQSDFRCLGSDLRSIREQRFRPNRSSA
jgi:hypothetical protein